ncbi:MAG TPA: hypothetical protein ENH35_03860 [Candidatus Moranbacteria bacterium]|nr:hypothetical protein [Candidatus Moranbacteria bacterium]
MFAKTLLQKEATMSDLMLDVDQAGELKSAFRRGDWTNAEIKKLSEGNVLTHVRQVVLGNAKIVQIKSLEFIGTIIIPAITKKFVAKDNFIVDTSRKTKVKISYLGDDFRKNFLGKTEKAIPETTLRYHKLRKSSADKPIIAELGGEKKAETTLAEMFALMEMQPNGEKGALPTNGYANIFYIHDVNGVLGAVRCDWGGVGWSVDACSVGTPRERYYGRRVFSRNSSES